MKKLLFTIIIIIISFSVFAQTNYYVANDGDDENNGTSPETPWQNTSRVNEETFVPGDSIFFKRGDIFRPDGTEPVSGGARLHLNNSGTADAYIYYGSYGEGDKPEILASELASEWTNLSGDVWWVYGFDDPYTGNNYNGELGFYYEDSIIWGKTKVTSISDLTELYEWTWGNDTVYIYCESNPNTYFERIEIPENWMCVDIENVDYVHFDGFVLANSQAFGIRDQYYPEDNEGNKGLIIENCDIARISRRDSDVGYGIYVKFNDQIIRYNTVHDCGRRTYSSVVDTGAEYTGIDSMDLRNVLIEHNEFYHGHHAICAGFDRHIIGVTDSIIVRNNLFYDDTLRDVINDPNEVKALTGFYMENHVFGQTNPRTSWVTNVYIYNNIIGYASDAAMTIRECDTVYVCNNTFYGWIDNILPAPDGSPLVFLVRYMNNVNVYNNVFVTRNTRADNENNYTTLSIPTGYDNQLDSVINIDYNLWYTEDPTISYAMIRGTNYYSDRDGYSDFADYQTATGFDEHSIADEDPLIKFSDISYIGEGSPLETMAGMPLWFVTEDYYGNTRSLTSPTVGAVEYGSSPPTPSTPTRGKIPTLNGLPISIGTSVYYIPE